MASLNENIAPNLTALFPIQVFTKFEEANFTTIDNLEEEVEIDPALLGPLGELLALEIQQLEPILTDSLVQEMLGQLNDIRVVRRAEDGEWLLSRDLDDLTLAELYEACQLRIPIAEAHLPCRDDALGRSAVAAMDELRIPLRELLKRRVGSIHAESKE